MPTIYLHVGTAKTGTSALQNFVCENLERLEEHGYYYPQTGRVLDCHHGIAFFWGDHDAFKKKFGIREDQLSRLAEEMRINRDKHILISSECLLLSTVDWEGFLSIFPHNNIKMIIYLRRQDAFISSRYRELVKGNQITQPPEEWIKTNFYPNEYTGILNRLSEYVGKENIIVRAYEKQQFKDGSIYSDFCDIFSIPLTQDFIISEKNFNPHLSRNALEFNRLLNTVFDAKSSPYIFSGLLTHYSLIERPDKNKAFQDQGLFSPEKRIEILEACKSVNQKIAREYLGRENGELFRDPPPIPNEPWMPYPGLSEDVTDKIASFLYQKNPDLIVKFYHELQETESADLYLQEAKETILPSLLKVIPSSDK